MSAVGNIARKVNSVFATIRILAIIDETGGGSISEFLLAGDFTTAWGLIKRGAKEYFNDPNERAAFLNTILQFGLTNVAIMFAEKASTIIRGFIDEVT